MAGIVIICLLRVGRHNCLRFVEDASKDTVKLGLTNKEKVFLSSTLLNNWSDQIDGVFISRREIQ